ncbi:MAG: hypothetical protein ABR606_00685 [Vicinamibacterales bacterium]
MDRGGDRSASPGAGQTPVTSVTAVKFFAAPAQNALPIVTISSIL